ncbi:MAG: RNA polymerase sigma factor [Clostridia bacterium]|nr:RNA polymerase sigma factor [Clostridia bacterium]
MDAVTFQAKALQLERLMFHVSWSILGREPDCADAVQEALTRAWQRRSSLRNPEKFKPWLMRILVNTCNDILRRQSRQTLLADEELLSQEDTPSDPLSVREAIECLKPEWRTVILLHYLEGCSVSEIAQMLQIPQGTVKSRLMYARKRLCALMKEDWEGDA